jgi:hypothetical protein
MDFEAMARELLAAGYLVQVRDGAQQQERTKTTRSCLQNLRHRFLVCLGWRSGAEAEAEYLAEPLVVEPRFREQFAIAHPTPAYEELLQVRIGIEVLAHAVACCDQAFQQLLCCMQPGNACVCILQFPCTREGLPESCVPGRSRVCVMLTGLSLGPLVVKSRQHSVCMVLIAHLATICCPAGGTPVLRWLCGQPGEHCEAAV